MASLDPKRTVGVLLVEDEEQARASLGRMLALKFPGIELYTAENGAVGLEMYRRYLPELVVTDIKMPQLNGIEMAAAIRACNARVEILFISAHNEPQYLHDAEGLGICIQKPVDRHKLFAAIDCCLERLSHCNRARP